MGMPKHQNKQTLLVAVDQINEATGSSIRVKSKSAAVIVETLEQMLPDLDHAKMLDNMTVESMETLIAFGLVKDFVDEETWSDELIETMENIGKDTLQANTAIAFDPKEKDPVSGGEEDGGDGDDGNEDSNETSALEKKFAEVQALEEEIAGCKKEKKLKKLNKKLKALKEEYIEMAEAQEGQNVTGKGKKNKGKEKEKPEKKKRAGSKKVGVIATIQKILEDNAGRMMSLTDIHSELSERLPESNPDTTIKTIRAQLVCRQPPCRMEKEKGITIVIAGTGNDRTFGTGVDPKDIPETPAPDEEKKKKDKKEETTTPAEDKTEKKEKKKKKKKDKMKDK